MPGLIRPPKLNENAELKNAPNDNNNPGGERRGNMMGRLLAGVLTLAVTAPVLLLPAASRGADPALPMHFDLRRQGPTDTCHGTCRLLLGASGAITIDTPDYFKVFAGKHHLAGAIMVLDSRGGSVHGAIKLGREIRKLGLDTTVGHLIELQGTEYGMARAKIDPEANCESMCAFVLIAGVHRSVPRQARVMVHEIWLGDRRDDPTAATYSAEDLVLVQRDIGRLAKYTRDMGAKIELLDLALRIPPWEPMHALSRAEIRSARVATDAVTPVRATVAAAQPASQSLPVVSEGVHAITISERQWNVVDHHGVAVLASRHPLTIDGEDIGSFDLMVACGPGNSYDVNYVEQRHSGDHTTLPYQLDTVAVAADGHLTELKVVSSQHQVRQDQLITHAIGKMPAALINGFADASDHSMIVTTKSSDVKTAIRLGNTGARLSLPQLAVACRKGLGERAAFTQRDTGGLAAAK